MRVSDGSIRVDGRLDDAAWGAVPMLTDFTQKEPVEGVEPTDRMEVRFAYDDTALYVGARMFSTAVRSRMLLYESALPCSCSKWSRKPP